MDSVHEAHLSRILEARRRRGVLGVFNEPVAAPTPRQHANGLMSPPPPPPHRRGSSAWTQTNGRLQTSAGAQTVPTAAPFTSSSEFARPLPQTSPAPADWRRSVPHGNAATAAASPNPRSSQDGGVRFQSPGRVPSLAYSTPNSASRRRTSPWRRPPTTASSPSGWTTGVEVHARPIAPLPPPLFVPRPRSPARETLWSTQRPGPAAWGDSAWSASPHSRPTATVSGGVDSWRTRTWSERDAPHLSRWGTSSGAAAPLMAWPSGGGDHGRRRSGHRRSSRRQSQRRRSRRGRHSSHDDDDDDDGDSEERYRELSSGRHGRSAARATSSRIDSRHRRAASRRRSADDLDGGDDGDRWRRSHPRARGLAPPPRGEGYAPPVVYMGTSPGSAPPSLTSREGSQRRSRSASAAPPPPRASQLSRASAPVGRRFALGLPDARSTMDLRTSVETLRAGDWFYKWTANGDSVHRRWVWVDTKSYLLVWSNNETHSPHFCGSVRLDHICQVTSRDLASVDGDGFPKTYYVLLIETTKRVLQLATELKDKCDAWFEALNNVMGFIHRNDMAKGALIPD